MSNRSCKDGRLYENHAATATPSTTNGTFVDSDGTLRQRSSTRRNQRCSLPVTCFVAPFLLVAGIHVWNFKLSIYLPSDVRRFTSLYDNSISISSTNNEYYKGHPQRLLFSLQPNTTVETFASCATRENCHILYWHIQKTGGTNLADRLFSMNENKYNSKYWCCNDQFMNFNFRSDPRTHCQLKMGVYEVRPDQFLEVIDSCRKLEDMKQDTFLGLVTIRQPLERTVSAIHQHCNVHPEHMDDSRKEICNRCDYSQELDRPFYDKVTNSTNRIFQGVEALLQNETIDFPLLIVDSADINYFINLMELYATKQMHLGGLLPRNETFHFRSGRSNSQEQYKDKICDFGMTSSVMKQHSSSLSIYRWILQGRYF